MGLLDGLLGALAGQGMRNQTSAGGLGGLGDLLAGASRGGGGGGGANLMTALLPVVLMMLQNRGGAGGAGGLGGLGGLLQQFQGAGLNQQVDSWVGTGANMSISPEQLINVLGRDRVAQMASQAGVSEDQASTGLAAMLPEFVNQLTPAGQMPADHEVSDALGDLQRSLGI